jgi:hypothetical protein
MPNDSKRNGPVVAYDLDGVLAESPPMTVKSWYEMTGTERRARKNDHLKHFQEAKVLFRPAPKFYIITARKKDVLEVTIKWVKKHFGNQCLGVFFLPTARTIPNVVAFKSACLKKIGATEFYEDNIEVLFGLKKMKLSGLTLFHFDPTKMGVPCPIT